MKLYAKINGEKLNVEIKERKGSVKDLITAIETLQKKDTQGNTPLSIYRYRGKFILDTDYNKPLTFFDLQMSDTIEVNTLIPDAKTTPPPQLKDVTKILAEYAIDTLNQAVWEALEQDKIQDLLYLKALGAKLTARPFTPMMELEIMKKKWYGRKSRTHLDEKEKFVKIRFSGLNMDSSRNQHISHWIQVSLVRKDGTTKALTLLDMDVEREALCFDPKDTALSITHFVWVKGVRKAKLILAPPAGKQTEVLLYSIEEKPRKKLPLQSYTSAQIAALAALENGNVMALRAAFADLNGGADPNTETRVCPGFLLLHRAIFLNNLNAVIAIVEAKADIEARTLAFGNVPPIMLAASYNSPEILAYLLAQGADINAQSGQGATLLHIAMVPRGARILHNRTAIESIVNRGGNPHQVTIDGYRQLNVIKDDTGLSIIGRMYSIYDHLNIAQCIIQSEVAVITAHDGVSQIEIGLAFESIMEHIKNTIITEGTLRLASNATLCKIGNGLYAVEPDMVPAGIDEAISEIIGDYVNKTLTMRIKPAYQNRATWTAIEKALNAFGLSKKRITQMQDEKHVLSQSISQTLLGTRQRRAVSQVAPSSSVYHTFDSLS